MSEHAIPYGRQHITDEDIAAVAEALRSDYLTTGPRVEDFREHFDAKLVPNGFSYNSGSNSEWVTVEQLRSFITEHVDPTFAV